MMRWRMMFTVVVCQVEFPGTPIDMELALIDSVLDPVEAHVNSARLLLFDVVIGDPTSRRIVSLDWCWWLWVSHFLNSDL
jgi:hypothetical protein